MSIEYEYASHFEWKTALCNTCVSTMNFSQHYDELDYQAQKRYRKKMDVTCLPVDPYVSKIFVSVMSGSTQELRPHIEYPDISTILFMLSAHTQENS